MNLLWIAALTLLVAMEKLAPKGDILAKALGALDDRGRRRAIDLAAVVAADCPPRVVFDRRPSRGVRPSRLPTRGPSPSAAAQARARWRYAVMIGVRDPPPLGGSPRVEALDDAVIRYEIRRRLVVRLFPEGNWPYGEPNRQGDLDFESGGIPIIGRLAPEAIVP